ncbi:unnamed protein product [Tilletia controversa]|uniref:BHLH domain-containing protein n=3 Tax=Tilletia TaxID=13289 RepID=A0A8X7MSD7_9BASI|nr:hypothetical protein CF336_g4271 [Tilletia laevis]KAE8196138.1 hypothetical protein CF328_g4223 [Tilletia controversa]KAE8259966.1 hypothetical protein A4X03_0g3943 [Tilletia caries]KAE8202205.1 hypothetical protein CF335_g3508 [Tilletia laevis]KAE8246558.1 hypothetical protein A4X06_0g4966 [Tilletia controversa]
MPRSSSISEARSPPLPPTQGGPGFSPFLGPTVNSFAYAHTPPLGVFEPTGPSAAITDRSPHPSPLLMPVQHSSGIAPLPSRAMKLPPAALVAANGQHHHQPSQGFGQFNPQYSTANSSRSTLASVTSSPASGNLGSSSGIANSNIPSALLPPPAVPLSSSHMTSSHATASTSPVTTGTSKRASASARDSKRRATHSQIERRRREKINDRLITLRNLVPACAREVEERRKVKAEEEEAARRLAQGLPPLSPTAESSAVGQGEAASGGAAGSASDKAKRKRSRRRAAAAAAAAAAADASGPADAEDKEEDLGLHKLEVLTHAIDYIYELQARIADLEAQVTRSNSIGNLHYASSIRSVSTAFTSPVMSLHADSPIMASFGRPTSGPMPIPGPHKSTTVSPLFEGFTVSGMGFSHQSSSSRHRPPTLSQSDSWRDIKHNETDGDVSPVSLYGRIPSIPGQSAIPPSMTLPPPAETSTNQTSEAFTAAAEALLSISASPDTLRPVSHVRDVPLPHTSSSSARKHPYARRATMGNVSTSQSLASEGQGTAASTFHSLQQDRAAAAAAVAGARAARRQSQAQIPIAIPGRRSSRTKAAGAGVPVSRAPGGAPHAEDMDVPADPMDEDNDFDSANSGEDDKVQNVQAESSNSATRARQGDAGDRPAGMDDDDEDVGDDTDPLSDPHVDSNGKLVTPPALELGESAMAADN